jgi:hypothetical protein
MENEMMRLVSKIRSRMIVYLRAVLRLVYARRLKRYPRLKLMIEKFSKSESAAVDSADAIALYEYIHHLKPNCILELGPGTSTNIIALAIDEIRKKDSLYSPRFLSFEENPEWLSYHEETFEPDLRSYVDLSSLPTEKKSERIGGDCAHYVGLPKYPYDFIFVDGPDFHSLGCEWSCDVIELSKDLAASVSIVFDGRESTVRKTWPALKEHGFKLKRHPFTLNYELSHE